MKIHVSLLGAALAVCAAAPLQAQTPATWTSPVNVTIANGSLTKTGGCDGCPDSGAHSQTQLSGDGYVEFVPAAGQRLFAGLSTDLTASTASSDLNYAFSIWPDGTWDIRENGTYKTQGTFVSGDRFRVAIENGVVVYRWNGTAVYTSAVAPVYPMVLDVTLYSTGASLSGATVVANSTTTTTTTPTTPTTTTTTPTTTTTNTTGSGQPTLTASGPYVAVTDRNAYPKPPVPALGPAGSTVTDPVFQSSITRITDAGTRPGFMNYSFRTPSNSHQNAWSAAGSYFYVVSDDGTAIPFNFDAKTGTASRINPTGSGNGGLVLATYIEPEFSYVNDSLIYGSYNGPGSNLHTIDQYDFSTGAYTQLVDLENLVAGLSGTYIGGIGSSAGPAERIVTFFGGASQDHHHYVLVFDPANPSNRLLLDTWASTINGQPASTILNFSLHAVNIDRSGRYVMLYTSSADQTGPRQAPQAYLWDTQTGSLFAMTGAVLPYGHDGFGYGAMVNQDCCTSTAWDAAQWQFRSMANPSVTRDMLPTVLSPKEVYLSDHPTWNNASPNALMPYITGTFRYNNNTAPWRALDDEIVAIETDVPGADPTIWRFAQHRSNVANDLDSTLESFWYEPRPNVSDDGQWVLFTSNWEKTLGTDPAGDSGAGARQDVFLVKLTANVPAQPKIVPVVMSAATLPQGRQGVAYSAALQATGGSGTYAWAIAAGALPAGVALDPSSGALSGVPTAFGSFTFTASAADASLASNSASASFTITIAPPAIAIAPTALPDGRVTLPYSSALQATGGSGTTTWSVSTGALPAGLTLNASSGTISGTPQAAGSSTFTVVATDAADATNTAAAAFAINVRYAPITLGAASLPGGRGTVPYAAALQAGGGSGAYVWTIAAGALPSGLSLNAATGAISGTPTTAGNGAFTVSVADAVEAANNASASYSIAIGLPAVRITSTSLPSGRQNVGYSAAEQAAGGSGAFVWSAVTTLPSGLSLNRSTGAITGTPSVSGTSAITVTAADASDATNSTTAAYSLVLTPAIKIVSPRTLPGGSQGVFYSYAVQTANGQGTLKWDLAGGALPPGMTLSASTGVVSGVCSTPGTYYFNARVKDASTNDTLTLGITIK